MKRHASEAYRLIVPRTRVFSRSIRRLRCCSAGCPGLVRALLSLQFRRGDKEYRYLPRVSNEEPTLLLLGLEAGRAGPLADSGDLFVLFEHHRPVAKTNPILRGWRHANPAPDVEAEVVMVAAGGDERGGVGYERHELETEHVPVEAKAPVEVTYVQVHVADNQPGTGLAAWLLVPDRG